MTKCDVCIIGGGAPGLVLAILLARGGTSVVLADAGPQPGPLAAAKPDGRTVALMGGSIETLENAGAWPALQSHAGALRHMAVADDSTYPSGAEKIIEQVFRAAELGRTEFGWNIPLAPLRAALHEQAAKARNINFLWNTGYEKAVKTASHSLLVGCDGRESAVRQAANIGATRRSYGQRAITCLIKHAKPHNDTSVEFHRPGGPFTYVPLPGNTCSVVWVEKEDDAKKILKLPKDGFTQALQDRTRGRLGKIELLTGPAAWPLEFLRSHRLTGPRTALAAEAAHVISPIGAQGLNLSLRDVSTLAEIINEAKSAGLDIGSQTVLERYEQARKADVIGRSFTIDIANQAVATDTAAIRTLRRMALKALSLPGPWRKLVMKKGLSA